MKYSLKLSNIFKDEIAFENVCQIGSHLARFWPQCVKISLFNILRPWQHGHDFADDTFKCIFLNENICILLKMSLKFVPKSPINNIPALVQIMAWRWPGDKPLSEPMMVRSLMHICITWPQWVNISSLNSIWYSSYIMPDFYLGKQKPNQKFCYIFKQNMKWTFLLQRNKRLPCWLPYDRLPYLRQIKRQINLNNSSKRYSKDKSWRWCVSEQDKIIYFWLWKADMPVNS